ncbi:unnamed protein product [Allacma fusca]|uniref:Uncharacterized protein n=1 Tax=Allacma fusca TaxID=39272 RepID=A0A8J2KB58_9HEXA|nr:unnamed protein product [Allacma fusca]
MQKLGALSYLLFCISYVQAALFCPLKWEPAGYGNVSNTGLPYGSVLVDQGLDNQAQAEYVGRVVHQSQWLFGRIRHYQDGHIHIGFDHQEFNYSMYQILTNPNNCRLSWMPSGYGAATPFAVSLESESAPNSWTPNINYQALSRGNIYYAGRIEVKEDASTKRLAGNINPTQFTISVGYHGEEKHQNTYDILTSIYPELVVDLSDFKFGITQADFAAMEENQAQAELIGQDNIVYDELKWNEVSMVKNLHMSLWFGGSDLQVSDISTTPGRQVKMTRTRDVIIDRELSIQGGVDTERSQIQVCSLALVLEDPQIPFTALGTFYEGSNSRGITVGTEQIVRILELNGRQNIRVQGDRVTAEEPQEEPQASTQILNDLPPSMAKSAPIGGRIIFKGFLNQGIPENCIETVVASLSKSTHKTCSDLSSCKERCQHRNNQEDCRMDIFLHCVCKFL